ncbi:putative HTH-type transcriptional regulator YxaF [Actinomadura rubteroloni]|uniref:Putative HTH-type transcriptional regulator YxaF n=1 Tax=Actinomadura rubteroloni TaxID=1926885 RepID=A0A2P4UEH5_9ACTN|nr:TetR/AcrR family transcriptional regulator [Actinomadura rubteroloni]POM23460.1 putative HTH-type transcriptional regulator YxaF [Actinomadura rubteroloni]
MARHGETRAALLRTAAELFRRQGYHGTGVNQVIAESGAPKGSLYFHFPAGKEQLAAEAVALSGTETGGVLATTVRAPDARAGITAIGEHFATELERSQFAHGCPVATVALETAAENETLRTACAAVYDGWRDGLAAALAAWGVPAPRTVPLADLTLSAVQGALVLARVRRDADVIRNVTAHLADQITTEIP